MSRHRKVTSEVDTISVIQSVCETSPSSEQAIDRIRGLCGNRDESSSTAVNAIREICHGCGHRPDHDRAEDAIRRIHRMCRQGYSDPSQDCTSERRCSPERPSRECFNPGATTFQSIITPVTNLTPQFSGATGMVQFIMRRKNKTVTLQWEPFTGTMAASGVAFLTVVQSISNLPPYPMNWPITIQYKGVQKTTSLTVDPHAANGSIRFFLNNDGTSTDIAIGDAFSIPASSVEWIIL